MSGDYFDILISGDSIALDSFGLPLFVTGRESIAQDIKNMIRESGYLIDMIAERNAQRVQYFMTLIEELVENDERIRPGTASLVRETNDTFLLTATTMKYGDVGFSL